MSFYLITKPLRVSGNHKVISEPRNVSPHWPESCRCTPNRPAVSRCSCIPCPDSWCCCSSVGSASSRSSTCGTRETGTHTVHISVSSVTLTTFVFFGPTPGQGQRLCGAAAVVHRFVSVRADWPRHAVFLQSVRNGNSAAADAAATLSGPVKVSPLTTPSPPVSSQLPCRSQCCWAGWGWWMASPSANGAGTEVLPSQS